MFFKVQLHYPAKHWLSKQYWPNHGWLFFIWMAPETQTTRHIWGNPDNMPSQLKLGLMHAHWKLSDYYRKIDESPYYTWALCASISNHLLFHTLINFFFFCSTRSKNLISGLHANCSDDAELLSHLDIQKDCLHSHYCHHYYTTPNLSAATPDPSKAPSGSPQKIDFTSWYCNVAQSLTDEVWVCFNLPHENFDSCDPLQWWAGHCAQFPGLSQFAQDILSIPGGS